MSTNASQIYFINNSMLAMARGIAYTVADLAPGTAHELFSSSSLIIWSGASDRTIYGDARVNWAFRAWHDAMHLKQGLGFTVEAELELARIQASQCTSDLMAELVYCEIAGQVEYFAQTGQFVADQVAFTLNYMRARGMMQ